MNHIKNTFINTKSFLLCCRWRVKPKHPVALDKYQTCIVYGYKFCKVIGQLKSSITMQSSVRQLVSNIAPASAVLRCYYRRFSTSKSIFEWEERGSRLDLSLRGKKQSFENIGIPRSPLISCRRIPSIRFIATQLERDGIDSIQDFRVKKVLVNNCSTSSTINECFLCIMRVSALEIKLSMMKKLILHNLLSCHDYEGASVRKVI